MSRSGLAPAAVLAASAALWLGCGADPPEAAAPAAKAQSRIAFSFGGRLYLMRPDGSGRVRLTGGRFARQDDGDSLPAWSPDGRTLAFVHTAHHRRSGDSDLTIRLIGARGGKARTLPVSGDLYSPAWSPDGRRLAFVRFAETEDGADSEVVVAAPDGSGQQVLYRDRSEEDEAGALTDVAWSPDGSLIAFTRIAMNGRTLRPVVYAIPAAGGAPRVLARDASGAAWSPDGRRIAFASIRDRNGRRCYESCSYRSELYVMDADGTDLVRLTRNPGDDQSPSWSPDGRRIVFQSDRNSPQTDGSELYSIPPDGACLTWLTNGSPSSVDPAWSRGSGRRARCGVRRRPAIVELDTGSMRERGRYRAYWLGKSYGGRLLNWARASRDGRRGRSHYLVYEDCGRYRPEACGSGLQLQQVPVCSRSGASTLRVLDQRTYRQRVRAFAADGLLFVDIGQHDLAAVVGETHVRVFTRGERGLARRALLDLRQVGGAKRPLPASALPADLLRSLRRTARAVALAGSVEAGARRLGISAGQARRRLELHRAVEALPSVRAVDCGAL